MNLSFTVNMILMGVLDVDFFNLNIINFKDLQSCKNDYFRNHSPMK